MFTAMAASKEVKAKAGKALPAADRELLETLAGFGTSGTRSPELWQACGAWSDRGKMAQLGDRVAALIDSGLIDFDYRQLPPRMVVTPSGREAIKASKPKAKRAA